MSQKGAVREILGAYVARDLLAEIAEYAAKTNVLLVVEQPVDMVILIDRLQVVSVDGMKRLVDSAMEQLRWIVDDVPMKNVYYYDGQLHVLAENPDAPTPNWRQLLIYARSCLIEHGYAWDHFIIMMDPVPKFIYNINNGIDLYSQIIGVKSIHLVSSPVPGSDGNVAILN